MLQTSMNQPWVLRERVVKEVKLLIAQFISGEIYHKFDCRVASAMMMMLILKPSTETYHELEHTCQWMSHVSKLKGLRPLFVLDTYKCIIIKIKKKGCHT